MLIKPIKPQSRSYEFSEISCGFWPRQVLNNLQKFLNSNRYKIEQPNHLLKGLTFSDWESRSSGDSD